ncbi:hypothetical protein SAMN04488112_102223 [Melghirimyces thermohalophilus]|uniref:Uncharacterized protein n=1 Tax=Melghirimyces thermohalophilus TaxID=1236220 RepID=A0A1G6IIE0_9BACL|nr:hypothetical protein SAMN04488112_102223 [Melghirimyces thermohalophilus]
MAECRIYAFGVQQPFDCYFHTAGGVVLIYNIDRPRNDLMRESGVKRYETREAFSATIIHFRYIYPCDDRM